MRISRVIILTVLFCLLQVTIVDSFKLFGVKPDLILIAVFIAALNLDLMPALALALSAGIFKDAFTSSALGFNVFLFPLWVFLIVKLLRRVSVEDNIARILLLFFVAILNNIISALALVYSAGSLSFGIFLRITFLASVYTALIFSLILKIVKK
jgi:rod shape-determining protein MreD